MLSKNARLWLGLIAMISLLSLASSCTKGDGENNNDGGPTDSGGETLAKKGNEGTISGVVSYNGTAPEAKKIDTSADSACTSKSPDLKTEEWVIKDGKLANTYVYIKDGTLADGSKIGDYGKFADMPASATLDQNGCHYK